MCPAGLSNWDTATGGSIIQVTQLSPSYPIYPELRDSLVCQDSLPNGKINLTERSAWRNIGFGSGKCYAEILGEFRYVLTSPHSLAASGVSEIHNVELS